MTTLANLITHDLIESGVLLRRYLKSSSLPIMEKMKHRPKPCHHRRDRVLLRLMTLSLNGYTGKNIRRNAVDDFCLHKSTIGQFTKLIFDLVSSDRRYRIKFSEWRDLRTIPMNRTWRMWVETTGDWLRARGVVVDIRSRSGVVVLSRPISNEEVHDYYVGHWLGRDERGEREETSKMDKGRMLHLMELHEQWCLDKGIPIIIPNNSEFMQLKQKQVAA